MSDWNYAAWAERVGIENLRGRLATGDFLLQQANTLLTVLLVGIGGSAAYGIKVLEPGPAAPGVAAALAACVWMTWVASILTVRCIVTRETQALSNEPANVYKPELGLARDDILGFEIERIQERIDKTKARNKVVAWWLDACRYATLATPVLFAMFAVVAGR